MSDRRRIVAALRAKADSTTFPAEAEALRSKADDLEGKLRAGERSHTISTPRQPTGGQWDWTRVTRQGTPWDPRQRPAPKEYRTTTWTGIKFSDVVGSTILRPTDDRKPGEERPGERWMTVTDIHGNTHRERIW